MSTTQQTQFARGDVVDVDLYAAGPGGDQPPAATVRAIVVSPGVELDVGIPPDDQDEVREVLDSIEPGLADLVSGDHWLLRNCQPEHCRMVEPGRDVVESGRASGGPDYDIVRVRSFPPGTQTRFEVHEKADDGRPAETWESGESRPSITVEVWWAEPGALGRPETGISWPSTSDKRPALAWMLSRALRLAVEETAR